MLIKKHLYKYVRRCGLMFIFTEAIMAAAVLKFVVFFLVVASFVGCSYYSKDGVPWWYMKDWRNDGKKIDFLNRN